MKKIQSAILLLFLTTSIWAQENDSPKNPFTSISIQLEDTYYRKRAYEYESLIFNPDLRPTNILLIPNQVALTLLLSKESKKRPGIEYYFGLGISGIGNYGNSSIEVFDSSLEENKTYYSNIFKSSYTTSINGRLIYNQNSDRRIKLYTGIGGTLGYTFYANKRQYTSAFIPSDRSIVISNTGNIPTGKQLSSEESNTSLSKGIQTSIYGVLGISATLSKKDNFLGRSSFYYEVSPRLQVADLSNLFESSSVNFYGSFGYKYQFKKKPVKV